MEYLEISGEVTLKQVVNEDELSTVLANILVTEFIDSGYVDISFKGDSLSINAEGTISESNCLKALFLKLQTFLKKESMIHFSTNRWETYIYLKQVRLAIVKPLQPLEEMAIAQ